MKNQLIVSILLAIVIGLIVVPESIAHKDGLMPFMIGASVVGGVAVYFLLGFFRTLFSEQEGHIGNLTKNSERQLSELEHLRDSMVAYQKETSSMVSSLASQNASFMEQISNKLVDSFKDISSQLLPVLEVLSSKIEDTKNVLSSSVSESIGKVNAQLVKQNEEEITLISTFMGKQVIEYEELKNMLSSVSSTFNAKLNSKIEYIGGLLTQSHELQSTINASTISINDSIEKSFGNLSDMNKKYENSLITINKSIEQFFQDNDNIQKEIHTTVEEVKDLQERLKTAIENQDAVIERVLRSAMDEVITVNKSTVASLNQNHDSIKANIENLIHNMKNDSEMTILTISESIESQKKLTDDILQTTLNKIERVSRDSNQRIEESHRELRSSLKDLFENQSEEIVEITETLEKIGNKIDDNLTIIDSAIADMANEMCQMSSTVPQLKELSKSEEQLMKELEKICMAKR